MEKLFIELCKEYHEKILKYLYYSLGNIDDARDLTQDVFLHVYDRIDRVKDHENIGGYIFQTAKYMACNQRRKAYRQGKYEVHGIDDSITTHTDVYEELIHNEDERIDESKYVDTVLNTLNDKNKLLYSYYYLQGLSYKEISKKLKISEPALRMKYMRLRKEIKVIAKQVAKENFVTTL